MSTMSMYSLTETDMMRNAEVTKVQVLWALVRDGLLEQDAADEWAGRHTVLVHKPKWRLFRRLFKKEEVTEDGLQIEVVGRAVGDSV